MANKSPDTQTLRRLISWDFLRGAVSGFRVISGKGRYFRSPRLLGFVIAATLLGVAAFVNLALPKKVPWQTNDYSHRMPVEIIAERGSETPQVVSVVIPRDKLADIGRSQLRLQALTPDDKKTRTLVAPQDARSPVVAWLISDNNLSPGRYFLYLTKTDKATSEDEIGKPFLLFDTFEDPWMSDWYTDGLAEGQAPFSWMTGLPQASRLLPDDDGTGYTIEALAEETTTAAGGPVIVISGKGWAVSWGRQDENYFVAQGDSESAFEKKVAVKTGKDELADLRVDVPRKVGEMVRFFVDGQLLATTPLVSEISAPLRVFLLRRSDQGLAYFRWVGVRPYQPNEPEMKLGALEVRQGAR